MLKEYLVVAQEALKAKKEMYLVKQQRLELAQREMLLLHELSEDNRSITSSKLSAHHLPHGQSGQSMLTRNVMRVKASSCSCSHALVVTGNPAFMFFTVSPPLCVRSALWLLLQLQIRPRPNKSRGGL